MHTHRATNLLIDTDRTTARDSFLLFVDVYGRPTGRYQILSLSYPMSHPYTSRCVTLALLLLTISKKHGYLGEHVPLGVAHFPWQDRCLVSPRY